MSPPLPAAFLMHPLAHRGLHDANDGRPENSREAIEAAIRHGYGIEIDLQLSADGQAMVFHDEDLGRLTGESGLLRGRAAAELQTVPLTGGSSGIPTFTDVLNLVAGKVPLLVEIKDQDGALGPDVGELEAAAARAAGDYNGPIAIMSFNPHSVTAIRRYAPERPRGLVTEAFRAEDWPGVPKATLDRLRDIPDFDPLGCSFISHDATALASNRVTEIKAAGHPVLCWTIRSPEAEARARTYADNVTFEGYLPLR